MYLQDMFKRLLEKKMGRIIQYDNNFELTDDPREEGWHVKGENREYVSYDSLNRKMKLVRKPSVHCINVELYKSKYPFVMCSYVSVPRKVCRKCEFYRKSTPERRFPICLFRAEKNPEKETFETFDNIMSDAINKTKELLES